MKWLFLIDPLKKLHIETDTTLAIMNECINRGIETYYAEIRELSCTDRLTVRSHFFNDHLHPTPAQEHLVDEFDLVFMRKEPPYDLSFHYATQLLSLAHTRVVNNPRALRDFNEKLIALNFPQFLPPTIVSSNDGEILSFIETHQEVVIKSLDSYQGKSVTKVKNNESGIKEKIKKLTENSPILVQQFLPQIEQGDKRILLLGGKLLGVVQRVPKSGSFLANFGQGGIGKKTEITDKEKDMCKTLSPFLIKNGIHFAGLDIIDGFLIEINITCPTGIQQINHLEHKTLEKDIVRYFEALS